MRPILASGFQVIHVDTTYYRPIIVSLSDGTLAWLGVALIGASETPGLMLRIRSGEEGQGTVFLQIPPLDGDGNPTRVAVRARTPTCLSGMPGLGELLIEPLSAGCLEGEALIEREPVMRLLFSVREDWARVLVGDLEGEGTENRESAGGKVRSVFVALRMSSGQARVIARRPVGANGWLGGIVAFARPREIGIAIVPDGIMRELVGRFESQKGGDAA